jgi:hypothetical protein
MGLKWDYWDFEKKGRKWLFSHHSQQQFMRIKQGIETKVSFVLQCFLLAALLSLQIQ